MLRLLGATVLFCAGSPALAAIFNVQVGSNFFSPGEVTIGIGDTVRWTLPSDGYGAKGYGTPTMLHNVVADDASFRSGSPTGGPWTYSHTFTQAGDYAYYCEVHGARGRVGMSGVVRVQGAAGPNISAGMAGAWFNPATTGQGFFFDVDTRNAVFAIAWFTWTDQPGVYDWLTGAGAYAGNRAEVLLNRTSGGRFNAPQAVSNGDAGTAALTFSDCSHARIQFNLSSPARQGTIDLVKLLPASPLCSGAASASPH
jgi:plastocyanin